MRLYSVMWVKTDNRHQEKTVLKITPKRFPFFQKINLKLTSQKILLHLYFQFPGNNFLF